MNGELAQSIALVAHGNAFLAGLRPDPPSLERENSAFRYVGSVEFRAETSFTGTAPWVGRHTVQDRDAPEHRIWRVVYSPHEPMGAGVEAATLQAAAEELRPALDEASGFANANDELTGFGDLLRDAAGLLEAEAPRPAYHEDLLPAKGYGLRAKQILAAATRAWVFGGMGSWNDAGFAPGCRRDEWERLTRRFFAAVVGAVVCATNSFDRGANA